MTVPLHEREIIPVNPTAVFDCGNQSADGIGGGGGGVILQYNRINKSYVYKQGFPSM